MMNVIKFISGCISYFIWHAQNSHQQADQLKQQTQKRLDLICWCATMSTLDDEEAIQGILANVMEEKVTIQKYTRETLARKVKFVSLRDMEHNGRMSLKVKKQLNYARQDWKEHWESLLAPCVRAALHEKRNSMVAGRRCYISIAKGARLAFCALLLQFYLLNH
jgi:hypothetical protein